MFSQTFGRTKPQTSTTKVQFPSPRRGFQIHSASKASQFQGRNNVSGSKNVSGSRTYSVGTDLRTSNISSITLATLQYNQSQQVVSVAQPSSITTHYQEKTGLVYLLIICILLMLNVYLIDKWKGD